MIPSSIICQSHSSSSSPQNRAIKNVLNDGQRRNSNDQKPKARHRSQGTQILLSKFKIQSCQQFNTLVFSCTFQPPCTVFSSSSSDSNSQREGGEKEREEEESGERACNYVIMLMIHKMGLFGPRRRAYIHPTTSTRHTHMEQGGMVGYQI